MKAKLTDAVVAKLAAPAGKQLLVWDTDLKGLGVLISTGTRSFVVRGVVAGRQIRKKVCAGDLGVKRARELAKDMMMQFHKGVDPRISTVENTTLADALEAFLARPRRSRLRPASISTYRSALTLHFADWLDRPVGSITRAMVERRFAEIATSVAAGGRGGDGTSSANGAMRALRGVLGVFPDRPNPVRVVMYETKVRTGILQDSDMATFWAAVWALDNAVARDYLIVLLYTGARRSELSSLKWENVDFRNQMLTFPASVTKTRKELVLPMSDIVHAALMRRRADGHGNYVFLGRSASGNLTQLNSFFEQIEAASGVRLSAHDLRRSFVTAAQMAGVDPYTQRRLVNHTVRDVHDAYIQFAPERLREPAQMVADRLKKLCGVAAPAGENVASIRG
jgi:integrase